MKLRLPQMLRKALFICFTSSIALCFSTSALASITGDTYNTGVAMVPLVQGSLFMQGGAFTITGENGITGNITFDNKKQQISAVININENLAHFEGTGQNLTVSRNFTGTLNINDKKMMIQGVITGDATSTLVKGGKGALAFVLSNNAFSGTIELTEGVSICWCR